MIQPVLMFASAVHVGGFKWTGNFTTIDLIAAATNALNGALLARRPDHYKNWTVVGILLMALLMGLGGGITRDVLVNQVPSALTNPAYITTALAFGIVGYLLAYKQGQFFREGLFQFLTSFSLPWYAIAGAQKGVGVGLPVLGCLALATIGPTAGRWYVDVSSGVPPKHFVRGEWFVAIAFLTGVVWLIADALGASTALSAGIAFVIGYAVRVVALYRAWEEPLAKEPPGGLRPRRRPPDARPQAQGQVTARAPLPRAGGRARRAPRRPQAQSRPRARRRRNAEPLMLSLIDPVKRQLVSARAVVATLLTSCRAHADAVGSPGLDRIPPLVLATGAERQRAWARSDRLGALVSTLTRNYAASCGSPTAAALPARRYEGASRDLPRWVTFTPRLKGATDVSLARLFRLPHPVEPSVVHTRPLADRSKPPLDARRRAD